MASASLLALIDDITTVLDDVALLSKAAAKKTAGVLGDDLALNAQQVAGVQAERELPVVFAVMKGSLRNKLILVPAALLISAVAPALVTPLLMLGGAYLCFEGFEKLWHVVWPSEGHAQAAAQHDAALAQALADPAVDVLSFERDKIRGAVRTDFILSAEIIAITLGTVADATLLTRAAVLAGVAVLMTLGVYGAVAAIVKMDDAGLALSRKRGPGALMGLLRALGHGLLAAAPWLMRLLSVAGTAAMFLVGGGIMVHGIPALHHLIQAAEHAVGLSAAGPLGGRLLAVVGDALVGLACGAVVLAGVTLVQWLRAWRQPRAV